MIRRILVGLGTSATAESVIRHAIDIAKPHSAEFVGLAVTDSLRLEWTGPRPTLATALRLLRESPVPLYLAQQRAAEGRKRIDRKNGMSTTRSPSPASPASWSVSRPGSVA